MATSTTKKQKNKKLLLPYPGVTRIFYFKKFDLDLKISGHEPMVLSLLDCLPASQNTKPRGKTPRGGNSSRSSL